MIFTERRSQLVHCSLRSVPKKKMSLGSQFRNFWNISPSEVKIVSIKSPSSTFLKKKKKGGPKFQIRGLINRNVYSPPGMNKLNCYQMLACSCYNCNNGCFRPDSTFRRLVPFCWNPQNRFGFWVSSSQTVYSRELLIRSCNFARPRTPDGKRITPPDVVTQ